MMRSGRASRAHSSASLAVGGWATAYPFAATTRSNEGSPTPVIRTTGGTLGMSMSPTRGRNKRAPTLEAPPVSGAARRPTSPGGQAATGDAATQPGSGRRRRHFRGERRVGVLLAQRKVPEHEADLGCERLQHTLQLGVGGAAERAFEIAVLHESHARVGGSQDMVAGADGWCEQRSRSLHPN